MLSVSQIVKGVAAVLLTLTLVGGVTGDRPSAPYPGSGHSAQFTRVARGDAPGLRGSTRPQTRRRLRGSARRAIGHEVAAAIQRGDIPGCVVAIGNRRELLFHRAYGRSWLEPKRRAMTKDAVFDLASLTKAVATATTLAAAVERGVLSYADPVAQHLPEFRRPDKERIRVEQLLTHTSGLPAVNGLASYRRGMSHALGAIARTPLVTEPGNQFLYSDLGFIVLGRLLSRALDAGLDELAGRFVFSPMGLTATRFVPGPRLLPKIVPTEQRGGALIHGRVHDPRASALGGVAGHAGLFSSAAELARLARMLLGEGTLDGTRVLAAKSVRRMTRAQRFPGGRTALGWDVPDDPHAAVFDGSAFGHDGFTGTSLWVDPKNDLFVVFLSSRLHPKGRGRAMPLAREIRRIAFAALGRERPSVVRVGIDVLESQKFASLPGERVALLTNSAARNAVGQRTADLLAQAPGVELIALLSPEHGMGVDREGRIRDGRDAKTGKPVRAFFTLDAASREAAMKGADVLVVDLPDAGARFFTYAATLRRALEAAAAARIPVVVLDRPNPLSGARIAGPISSGSSRSMVNPHPLPIMHGLTQGELARLFVAELGLDVRLEVVRASGWRRSRAAFSTGLKWVAPSPNLKTLPGALLYPGIALFEFTNLSVGRGTPQPFTVLGAPWIDGKRLAARLSRRQLPGVEVVATVFTPRKRRFAGRRCRGIRIRLTNPGAVRPVRLAFHIARELMLQHPEEWQDDNLSTLLHHPESLASLRAGKPLEEIFESWDADLRAFDRRRQPHLLYP